ncbi:hypothetical protein PhCBS80983_g02102 [Powellomyces hirtus]|uniref:Uncharacterized protein n=1 Tax=Powellomyces hirtus TaxID=109895 RepID=A0A507E7A9_9FUNG|nr:hypothetical protein PhCBS80983_g02102 [Powellomyces hirtus]
MTTKLTTFIVGPPRTGKTCISNHLAELSESLGGAGAGSAYHPTQGVRILEFDRAIPVNGKQVEVACEVWDCSGDSRCVSVAYCEKSKWAERALCVHTNMIIDSKHHGRY